MFHGFICINHLINIFRKTSSSIPACKAYIFVTVTSYLEDKKTILIKIVLKTLDQDVLKCCSFIRKDGKKKLKCTVYKIYAGLLPRDKGISPDLRT